MLPSAFALRYRHLALGSEHGGKPISLVVGCVLDEVGDGLERFWDELQEGAELGGGDAGIADEGEEFGLLAE